jgi:transposase, IS30 family
LKSEWVSCYYNLFKHNQEEVTVYKQLTLEQRYSLHLLKQEGRSMRGIARCIGVHPSTVSRELRRNAGRSGYRHPPAHRLAVGRRMICRKPTKLTLENIRILRRYIRKDWSPEQISCTLKTMKLLDISHETIYKLISRDKQAGGCLYKHLRIKNRLRRKKYGTGKRVIIPNKKYIDERPAIVEEKSRVGDWELDTIVSARGGKHALVTMVERRSRYTLIDKITSKEAHVTARSIIRMLAAFKDKVLTLTSDNGTEFRCHEIISRTLDADFYFAHSYKAWQRGLNENTNGLIRQYFPKKSTFENIGRKELIKVCGKLNNRPRKSIGFRTPKEVFHSSSVALQT